jgi:hypothetical protein
MTTGHQHRIVRLRRRGLRWWLLQRTLWTTRDRTWAIESPYPVQECRLPYPHDHVPIYRLTVLGFLHRWTGLTVAIPDPDEPKPDPDCIVCSPKKARARQQTRNRKMGGYSSPPRCPKHALKLPPVAPPGRGAASAHD